MARLQHAGDLPAPTRSPIPECIVPSPSDPVRIPDDRLHVEKRADGAIVVRVRSEGTDGARLPDAVFSFRCGDPQYAYWLGRLKSAGRPAS